MTTYLETTGYPVAQAAPEARAMFIRKTYAHLAGAIAGFVVLEVYLQASPSVAAWIIIGLFFAIRVLAVRYDWRTQPVLRDTEAQ